MSLGVLNNLSAMSAAHNLSNTQSSLAKTLEQLSSGSKINSGADDAAGLSLVNGLQANATALSQSQTNATEGVGLLTVADGALSQVTNLLNRAVTLATEVSNGTLNGSQNTAANQEYQSILSEINNIGATTTYNQKQVFGSQTGIYTGDSSTQGASINQLNIRSLSSDNVGDSNGVMAYSNGQSNVFVDLSKGSKNAAVTDSLGTLPTDSTTITVNYMTQGANGSAIQASANISVGAGTTYANTAQGLISAINNSGLGLNATFGTAAQAGTNAVSAAIGAQTATGGGSTDTGIIVSAQSIGANTAGTNGVGEVGTLTLVSSSGNADGDTMTGTLNIVGSDGKSHSVTLGQANSTDTLANLASTINAAGWGLTAKVTPGGAGTTATLAFTSTNSGVSISQSSAALSGGGTGFSSLTLGSLPTAQGTQQTTKIGTVTTGGGADTSATTASIAFGSGGAEGTLAIAAAQTGAGLVTAINSGKYGVTAVLNSSGNVDLYSANSAETVSFTQGGGAWTEANSVLTSSAYYGIGISGVVGDTSTGGGTANVGIVADNNGSGGVATISYSDSGGQSLSATGLANSTDAQHALTALNSAIAAVAAQDGYIGAQINTLNAVSSVMSTQQQNVVAAQNAVQATDYATAASNMSKYQILSQTGISALAQANSAQQAVLKLLQ